MYIFHVTKHPLGVTAMTGPKMSWPLGQILIGNLWSCDKAGAEFGRCRQCQLNVCGSITYKYIFGGVGWTSIFQQFQFSPGDLPWVTNSHGWCHARDRRGQRSFCTRKKLVVQGWTAWDSPVFIFFWLDMWRICTQNKVSMHHDITGFSSSFHLYLMDFNGLFGLGMDRKKSKHKKMVAVEDWRWPTLVHCCQKCLLTLLEMSWQQRQGSPRIRSSGIDERLEDVSSELSLGRLYDMSHWL